MEHDYTQSMVGGSLHGQRKHQPQSNVRLTVPGLFVETPQQPQNSDTQEARSSGIDRPDVCLASIEVQRVCSVACGSLELSPHSIRPRSEDTLSPGTDTYSPTPVPLDTPLLQRRLANDFTSPSPGRTSFSTGNGSYLRDARSSLRKLEKKHTGSGTAPVRDVDMNPYEQGQYPLENISFIGLLHLPATSKHQLQTSAALDPAAQKAVDKSVIKEADRLMLQMNDPGTQPIWLRWPGNMFGKQQWLRQMQRQHWDKSCAPIRVKHFVPVENLKAWHEFNRLLDGRRVVLVQSLARRYPLRKLYKKILEEQLVVTARHQMLKEKQKVHRLNLRLDSLERLKEEKRRMQWNPPDRDDGCCGSELLQVAHEFSSRARQM